MAGIYTQLEKELKKCLNDEERYKVLRAYVREHELSFEQTRYILETAR